MAGSDKYDLEGIIEVFLTESREMLEQMESALIDLEKDFTDQDSLNTVFRSAHTIKGSSGMFGFTEIGKFTHIVEDLLGRLRSREIPLQQEIITLALKCRDFIGELIDLYGADRNAVLGDSMTRERDDLVRELNAFIGREEPVAAPAAGAARVAEERSAAGCWRISLRFGEDLFRHRLDPKATIHYLGSLGSIERMRTLTDRIPPFADANPESCYLGFEFDLRTAATREEIDAAFDFIREDCDIRFAPAVADEGDAAAKPAAQQAGEPVAEKQPRGKSGATLRIGAKKLDELINLVGEIIINKLHVEEQVRLARNAEIADSMGGLSGLIEELRERSMSMRMVPIGETFRKFERTVRDLSRELGKEIDLVLVGEETELDKTMVDKIGDPLMHLVRNSIDHGIEPPEVRRMKGKSEKGTVVARAYHEAGNVVINLSDDGGGLNRDRILTRARERGLVSEERAARLPDREVFQFIFEPGFSTAEKVTSVSGRGVGMDVVRSNIESIGGSVIVSSEEGKGTSVNMVLPLTLAIIDGFLFSVGESWYIIPLNMVLEWDAVSYEELTKNGNGSFVEFRGETVPYIRLRDLFREESAPQPRENIIFVENVDYRVGIVADRIVGKTQTVVKPLGILFNKMPWISGATILGSGDVAPILNIPKLVQLMKTIAY